MITDGTTEKTVIEKNPRQNYIVNESNETEIDLGELLLRFLEHIKFIILLSLIHI